MKFTVTMKNSDAVHQGLLDAGVDVDNPPPEVQAVIDTWFDSAEYMVVEFDTETNTAVLLPKV